MCIFGPWIFFCSVFLFLIVPRNVAGETVRDRLSWPPVFERRYGNPEIVIREGDVPAIRMQFVRPLRRIFLTVPYQTAGKEIDSFLGDYFLKGIWEEYLSPEALTAIESKFRHERDHSDESRTLLPNRQDLSSGRLVVRGA